MCFDPIPISPYAPYPIVLLSNIREGSIAGPLFLRPSVLKIIHFVYFHFGI